MGLWHRITGYHAHKGAGRNDEYTFFAFLEDALEGLNLYRRMPGVKRDKTPNIVPLSKKDTESFKRYLEERGIFLKDVNGAIHYED